MTDSEVTIFQLEDGKTEIQVKLENDTVWLSQKQMAELFDKDPDTISLHLKNVFESGELEELATTGEFSVVQKEGQRSAKRKIKFYNLDAIISVGYRVNSKRGIQFRIWAIQILKEYLVKGYALSNPSLIDHFEIRPAKEADVKLILQFITELGEYEKLSHEVVATEENLRKTLFQQKMAEVIIGEFNGLPVGFALFFHNFSTFLGQAGIYLEDLYIKPDMRGKGFGKNMLKYLAKIAVERGCGRLEWACLDWNEPSICFYKGLGAKSLDDWTVYRLAGKTLHEMAKEYGG